jgi:hypothetical protein
MRLAAAEPHDTDAEFLTGLGVGAGYEGGGSGGADEVATGRHSEILDIFTTAGEILELASSAV